MGERPLVSDFGGRLSGHMNVTGRLYGRLYKSGRLLYGSFDGRLGGEVVWESSQMGAAEK